MKFLDEVIITIISGNGGKGASSFRRERCVPEGGPDGGDGGNGGDVCFIGSTSFNTLYHLKTKSLYKAQDGENGKPNKMTGKRGENITLYVPLGTIIKDAETDEILFDITQDGQKQIVLKGGQGGLGNWHFRNSINQAPTYSQKGLSGERLEIKLELKLVADIGIIGYPNVGKSTFISVVSNATPEVADYPFTTLTPHLGVVNMDNYTTFVIADIPGIIEGAHEGTGLGIQFLKHIERTKMFLHIVEYSESIDEMFEKYNIINNELYKYNEELSKRPQVIAISKSDLIIDDEIFDMIKEKFKNVSEKIFFMSAPLHQGTKEVIYYLYQQLQNKENNL